MVVEIAVLLADFQMAQVSAVVWDPPAPVGNYVHFTRGHEYYWLIWSHDEWMDWYTTGFGMGEVFVVAVVVVVVVVVDLDFERHF